jgi:hypothetical protein
MEVQMLDHNGQSMDRPSQRELTSLLVEAVQAAGCSDKEVAITQGIDPAHWSRIKSGEKRAYLDRVGRLPLPVQREFVKLYAQELKMRVSEADPQRQAAATLVKAAAEFLAEVG